MVQLATVLVAVALALMTVSVGTAQRQAAAPIQIPVERAREIVQPGIRMTVNAGPVNTNDMSKAAPMVVPESEKNRRPQPDRPPVGSVLVSTNPPVPGRSSGGRVAP